MLHFWRSFCKFGRPEGSTLFFISFQKHGPPEGSKSFLVVWNYQLLIFHFHHLTIICLYLRKIGKLSPIRWQACGSLFRGDLVRDDGGFFLLIVPLPLFQSKPCIFIKLTPIQWQSCIILHHSGQFGLLTSRNKDIWNIWKLIEPKAPHHQILLQLW